MKKIYNNNNVYAFAKAIIALLIFSGCQPDDQNLELATFPNIAEVFTDVPVNLTDQFFVSFDPNAGANTNGFGTDNTTVFEGSTSIRIDVPSPNDPNGNFIGGIFLDRGEGRNLTTYNTLSFYALGSTTATISVGFGTDFETNSFAVSTDIDLRTGWNKYVIPIPNADRLVQERGMFLFAAGSGSTNGFGYTFWLDEIRFENSNLVSQNGAAILGGQNQTTAANAGSTVTISDTFVDFNVLTNPENAGNNAELLTVTTTPGYFDFTSSNESVATVDAFGVVSILSDEGTAVITASLDGMDAVGSLSIMEVDGGNNVDDSGNTQVMLPLGFESSTLPYNPMEFGGAPSAVVANPMIGGLNNSTNVLSTQKVVGSEPFAGIIMDLDVPVDFSEQQQVSALVFSPAAGTTVLLGFEDSNVPGAPSPSQIAVTETTTVANQWQELTFDYTGLVDNAVDYNRLVLIYNNGTPGDDSVFFIDDIQLTEGTGGDGGDEDNLLENGDFEQGMVTWFGNAFNVVEDGGNSFNQSDNEIAPNPFDVNLSHPVELTGGTTYTLSFDAATSAEDVSRTLIAGIGLNEGDFSSATETVTVTSDLQTYTLTLTPPAGSANSRVLFDLGADNGLLVIDNVVLTTDGMTGGGGDELLSNGDFEQGMITWFGNAFNVVEDGGNNFNQSDNEVSGSSFDVNLSHPVELMAGTTYTLSFDAATSIEDGSRTIIAGIGLNEGGFEAAVETVTITSDLQTYTLTLTPPLGSANSRVLFDLGADAGVLVLDNVSLILN